MLTLIIASLAVLALSVLLFLGICFYFYVQALAEAHRDGWDMPN